MNSFIKMRRRMVRGMLRHLGLWQDVPLEEVARRQNRFAYSPRVAWLLDRTWMEPYRDFLQQDCLPAAGADETRILDRRFTLASTVKAVRGLRGSTAECGVFKGVGSGIICQTLEDTYAAGECHFGFDSFEGLPEPKSMDRDANQQLHWKAGDLAVPETIAKSLLDQFECCRLVKGWLPESLSIAHGHKFRFVHVDVDLAQPTLDVLEFFYDRMTPGGIILFDDYGFISCPGARAAIDRFFAGRPEPVLEVTAGQAIVVKVDPRIAKAS
jgi:O-methyltransferase